MKWDISRSLPYNRSNISARCDKICKKNEARALNVMSVLNNYCSTAGNWWSCDLRIRWKANKLFPLKSESYEILQKYLQFGWILRNDLIKRKVHYLNGRKTWQARTEKKFILYLIPKKKMWSADNLEKVRVVGRIIMKIFLEEYDEKVRLRFQHKKYKKWWSYSCKRPWRPMRLWDVEAPISAHRYH
jgi:hypothetical protein